MSVVMHDATVYPGGIVGCLRQEIITGFAGKPHPSLALSFVKYVNAAAFDLTAFSRFSVGAMDLAPPNNALGDDCADADNSFGPAVVTWCRVFDFTLLFENVVFSLLPAAALLLASLFRFQQIRHAREVASASALLPFSKLVRHPPTISRDYPC